MTRGYACVCEKNKVKQVAYLQSDAYLSGYGKEILSCIMNDSLDEWFDDQIDYNHELYGKEEPSKFFELSWIKKNKDFPDGQVEYGYLYDLSTGSLKVYHYGTLLHEVKKEEREKYLFFFKNESNIEKATTYNKDRLSFGTPNDAMFRNLVKESSVDVLQDLNEKGKANFMTLADIHLIGPGHSSAYPVYQKILRWEASGENVKFHVGKSSLNGKWDIDIQLPFIRVTIGENFQTESSAVKAIKQMASQNPSAFERFAEVASAYEKVKYTNSDTIQKFIDHIQTEWEKNPWYSPRGFFTPDRIKKELLRSLTYVA